jgi:hypothetical protein
MKNGIDFLLIVVLLVTIGLLIFFGLGDVSPVAAPTSSMTSTSTFTSTSGSVAISTAVVSATRTSAPTKEATATLIPASVTIPTNTFTVTPRPTLTATLTSTTTPTATVTLGTDSPVSQIGQEIKSGIERGNTIVKAIEAYQTANGQYPPTLNALVPLYLPAIPITSTGQAFFYRLFDGSSPLASEVYWVSFRAINQDHVACTYFRRLDYWDCNFESP